MQPWALHSLCIHSSGTRWFFFNMGLLLMNFFLVHEPKRLYLWEIFYWKRDVPPLVLRLNDSRPVFQESNLFSKHLHFSGYRIMWQYSQPHLSVHRGENLPAHAPWSRRDRGEDTGPSLLVLKGSVSCSQADSYAIEKDFSRCISVLLHSQYRFFPNVDLMLSIAFWFCV